MDWSEYYQHLNNTQKQRFILRTIRFYRSIVWESHESFTLSKQDKILIISAFIQITFGFKKHKLHDFETILIMPIAYSYIKTSLLFNGDVNLMKTRITMAWPAIKRGFEIPDDSMNLCIHEFAHCLVLEDRVSIFYRFFNQNNWKEFTFLAERILPRVKRGDSEVLRKYGGTNIMEFFAVCLETFFENPLKMHFHEPELFQSLKELMNQDPRLIG